VIRKHGPSFQLPAIILCQLQQPSFQQIQPLIPTKEMLLVECPRRDHVRPVFAQLVNRSVRPNLGVRWLDTALQQTRRLTFCFPCRDIVCKHLRQFRLRLLQLNYQFLNPRPRRFWQLANSPNQLLSQFEWLGHRSPLKCCGSTQPSDIWNNDADPSNQRPLGQSTLHSDGSWIL